VTGADPGSLQAYDPLVIGRYYRWRFWTIGWRILQISWWLGTFVLGLQSDLWLGREEQNQPRRASQLRQVLTNLGPTFIKVGQALSTRPDLVRKDFLEELIKLQDQLPPFPTPQARAIIQAELDYSPEEIFSSFSPPPWRRQV
jgi:predicted unusual protein kinase regulating ubiquinone biosynthesis (AarF/ABC1/UbiB family)